MKKLAALVVLGLVLTGCKEKELTEWEITCALYSEAYGEDVCEGLDEAVVEYEDLEPGLYGYYDGSDTVFVSDDLELRDRQATIIHEMVHYIDHHHFGLPVPGPARDICLSEAWAWHIEGVFWTSIGQPDKVRADWWKSYPHCWEFYADKTFVLSLMELLMILDGLEVEVIVE